MTILNLSKFAFSEYRLYDKLASAGIYFISPCWAHVLNLGSDTEAEYEVVSEIRKND